MLEGITFESLLDIGMAELTDNTLILFSNSDLLYKFSEVFDKFAKCVNFKKDTDDDINYNTTTHGEELTIKEIVCYKAAHIYDINKGQQKIIMTVEPTIALSMKDKWDLWFININSENKLSCWALTDIKGYESHGLNDYSAFDIYAGLVSGKFCCYEGYTGK